MQMPILSLPRSPSDQRMRKPQDNIPPQTKAPPPRARCN